MSWPIMQCVDVRPFWLLFVRCISENRAGISLLRERIFLKCVLFLFLYSTNYNHGKSLRILSICRSTFA